jgi:hypothetical protein
MSNTKVDAVAEFTFKIWIADLEGEVSAVWSKVVQLFQRRCAIRVRVIRDEGAALPSGDTDSRGAGKTCEASVWKNSACG